MTDYTTHPDYRAMLAGILSALSTALIAWAESEGEK